MQAARGRQVACARVLGIWFVRGCGVLEVPVATHLIECNPTYSQTGTPKRAALKRTLGGQQHEERGELLWRVSIEHQLERLLCLGLS